MIDFFQTRYPMPEHLKPEFFIERTKIKPGDYQVEMVVSHEATGEPEYIRHIWEMLHFNMIEGIVKMTIGLKDYLVFRLAPYVLENPHDMQFLGDEYKFGIRAHIMIAQTQQVTIPELVFDKTTGEIKEFRCGHCSSPYPAEKTHCPNCGAPRALLLHELEK